MAVLRRVLSGCLIGVLSCAVPARADIIAQTAQGFVSRNVVVVAASPAAVWKRLITPAVWWSSDHTFSGDSANLSLDPMPGGCFCERLPGDAVATAKGAKPVHVAPRGGVEHMRVIYSERGKALRMTGALGPLQSEAVQATLTVTLKAVDGGTRIVFEYAVGGYMRYPAEKIVPAIDTVLGNQLLGLAHGFAPDTAAQASDKPDTARPTPENTGAVDVPAPAAKGLDKHGLLLPRGRIWSLPPSDGPVAAPPTPAPVVTPLPTDAVPQDVTPSGGAKGKARRGKAAQKPVAPRPVAPEPVVRDPVVVVVPPEAAPVAPPPEAEAPVVRKKRAKANKTPVKPVTPPKSDEPSTDAVNSAFDNALGDPQRPVPTTP